MNKRKSGIIILLIFLNIITASGAVETNSLAPHPVYFSVDGEPRSIKIEIDGKRYKAHWDGASLGIDHVTPENFNAEPPNEGPPDWGTYWGDNDKRNWAFIMDCFNMFVLWTWALTLVIVTIMGEWTALWKTFLAGLVIIIILGQINSYFNKKMGLDHEPFSHTEWF